MNVVLLIFMGMVVTTLGIIYFHIKRKGRNNDLVDLGDAISAWDQREDKINDELKIHKGEIHKADPDKLRDMANDELAHFRRSRNKNRR